MAVQEFYKQRLSTPEPLDTPRWGDESKLSLPDLSLPDLNLDMSTTGASLDALFKTNKDMGKAAVGESNYSGMNPAFTAALSRVNAGFAKRFGREFRITSGFRTNAQQADLYRRKPNLAARPGTSWHERGAAVDINWSELNKQQQDWLRQMLPRAGIRPPSWNFHYNKEPWHWQWYG